MKFMTKNFLQLKLLHLKKLNVKNRFIDLEGIKKYLTIELHYASKAFLFR